MASDKNRRTPRILLNMAVDKLNDREVEVLNSQYSDCVSASGAVPLLCPSIEREEIIESLLEDRKSVV